MCIESNTQSKKLAYIQPTVKDLSPFLHRCHYFFKDIWVSEFLQCINWILL